MRKIISWCFILFLILMLWISKGHFKEEQLFPEYQASSIYLGSVLAEPSDPKAQPLPVYAHWLRGNQAEEMKPGEIMIQAVDYSAISHDSQIQARNDEQKGNVIDWTSSEGWIEWTVEAPQEGLYALTVEYFPLKGSYASIARGIQINERYPYQEAERIILERLWKDGQYPYERNGLGNEIRPVQTEITKWSTLQVVDYAVSSEPLLWPLKKGKNTIRMTGGREPVALASLIFAAPQRIPSYADYVAANSTPAELPGSSWYTVIEAEQYAAKSAIGIQTQSLAEPYISPDPKGRLVYNTIGGERWQQAGDWIEWAFTVPSSGWYVIDMKYLQAYNGKAAVYRTVLLDGKVPFRELLHYALPAQTDMTIKPFMDDLGQPYLFWLEEGDHQLRLIADSALIAPAVQSLRDALTDLSVVERDIRLISGNYGSGSGSNLDTGRNWQLKTYDPHIETKLSDVIERLRTVRDYANGLNQHVTDPTTAISAAMNSLEELLENVNDIPNQIKVFADIQSSINTWLKPMESQALLLDFLVVREREAEPELELPGLWDRISYGTHNFVRTFFQQYDLKDLNEDEALTIWVQRGRDYVDLLQKMIEADFTPRTGIQVNVNLMPSTNVLMLGNAAGDQPDIALGIGMETPVDYAMRGAAADLSVQPGFEQIVQRFSPGVMRSYSYDGGIYGLPETQSFAVMFYRTDVFERLGLHPPDTWDEMLDLMPTLQENGMELYYPAKEFIMPFYQEGVEFYTEDGMRTNIDSEAAQTAFRRWTDLFSIYNVPKEVPAFFNHFRFGDMPIGIADYNTYIQLSVAAPEISGKWKMAPLPGRLKEDGTVVRWSAQSTTAAMVMEKSERKDEAWKFLDWWTSRDTQASYANDIESFAGIEYRWNSANLEALQDVPWPEEDMRVLTEQASWGRNMPYVPGYYFLGREMDFAWNNTVLSGMPPNEALRKAAISLQREMTRKQKEFGFGPDTNLNITRSEEKFSKSLKEGGAANEQ
ncbi:extracellular solute-binding protein [Paenibacillus sp. MY03]|uniref:extracellular solute-binding protein n=1 Tax=Paenibacillus sp. MY03 TaxID=302980 RepID=UPI0015C61CA0|nr:extracellular solute-binding protein [Paenibacillus sp. MY03]